MFQIRWIARSSIQGHMNVLATPQHGTAHVRDEATRDTLMRALWSDPNVLRLCVLGPDGAIVGDILERDPPGLAERIVDRIAA